MNALEARAAMRDLGTKAQAVVNDDSLSAAEKMTRLDAYQSDLKKYSDEVALSEKAALFSGLGGDTDAKGASREEQDVDRKAAPRSLGEAIVGTEAFTLAAKSALGRRRFQFTEEVGTKVAATNSEGVTVSPTGLSTFTDGTGSTLVQPNFLPGIVDLRFAPLAVADLFSQGTTSSPIISYVKQATETIGAAAVAEKGLKPGIDATFQRLNEQVGKIAAVYKITDEMLQDVDQAQSFLTGHLTAQIRREEEQEVINGTGYPSVNGILGRTGFTTTINVATGTLANPLKFAEAIFQQVTAIRTTAFVEPDAVVLNPLDWQYLQLAKDANNQYFSGGPFTGSYGNGGISNVAALWGLRVVTAQRIPQGTALVGGYKECAQFFRRQGITVEMTNSNEDDFIHNLVTVRAESRSALVVYRPAGFGKVTVTWA